MKKRAAIVATFISVYLFFVIAFLPVGFILNWVTLPSNVDIGVVKGSIWHSEISAIKVDSIQVNKVIADLGLFSLLTLDPEVSFRFGNERESGPSGQANVSELFSQVKLTNVSVKIAADTIAQAINKPIPMLAHGSVKVELQEFTVGKPLCYALNGIISWPDAAITALEELVELGAISATLTCEQGEIVAAITEGNSLGLSFTASIGDNFHLAGDGYLKPTNTMPSTLRQALPFLGRPDNQGRYRLRF